MSFKKERLSSLLPKNMEDKDASELQSVYGKVLKNGLQGLCFSAYAEGQKPEDQLRRRLEILKPHVI